MWKTIGGRCIYQTTNGAKVHQNMLYRWLTLNSPALQTLISRRSPEKPELGYIHQLTFAVRAQPADCCLLGLGGAGVVHALAPYLTNATLLAIENNPEVIHIASTYFMSAHLKNLSITQEDASLFVATCQTRYQHLMVDLFESHTFPEKCSTHDFFTHCRRLLLPNGILALNLTNLDEQWPIFNHVRDIFFQRTVALPVKGSSNMIVLACNSPSVTPLLDLLTTNRYLKKLSWDGTWGCIAII